MFPGVAAQLAGISSRTYFEWISRGEGRHPTRSCTPKLKTFAREATAAHAQARAFAEARVYRENPKHWLAHAARTKADFEGWTQPKEDPKQESSWLDRMLAKVDEPDETD